MAAGAINRDQIFVITGDSMDVLKGSHIVPIHLRVTVVMPVMHTSLLLHTIIISLVTVYLS